ncbi:MAG: alpha/beta fold hydrolase, partial [Myxococcota bacterium]|nr:alpha/beta fold hydrolase [Myxococcota bacterium]
MRTRDVETRRGIRSRLHEAGEGEPLLYLHGAGGLLPEEPLLERLAERFHVLAPEWPGYGESEGEAKLEDMLDFALHGWDLVEALDLERPFLVGHSMGGMIAAEMAALAPRQLARLVLL